MYKSILTVQYENKLPDSFIAPTPYPFLGWQSSSRTIFKYQSFYRTAKVEIGVAIIAEGKDTLTIENNHHYPLMSVFKLHQALAVGNYCEKHRISFDTLLTVSKTDLKRDTYSPLRDQHPNGGKFSLKQLMQYTLHLSDNNACDILFRFMGGPDVTDRYIRSLGIKDFSVQHTEEDMHRNLNLCYQNWSTPLATAEVIEALLTRPLFDKEHQEFIKKSLITCQTGKSRIVRPLQDKNVIVGHKTGTGDYNKSGQLIAINDAGFIVFPDGRRYTLVVFVKNSQENPEHTEVIIAHISEMVYQAFSKP